MRKLLLFALSAALLAAIMVISAAPSAGQESSEVELIIPDEEVPTTPFEYGTLNAVSGAPVALYQLDYKPAPGTAEEMARDYLENNSDLLRLLDPALSDLNHQVTREGPSGTVVRFFQSISGVPVYKAGIVVHLNQEDRVSFVTSSYKETAAMKNLTPDLTAGEATRIAYDYLDLQEAMGPEKTTLYVYHNQGQSRLVYQVRAAANQPLGDWEVLVDAHSGELVKVVDLAFDVKGESKEGESTMVDGTGYVFDPDPLTSATAHYGDPGFEDGSDATTPQLDGERFLVTLPDIQFSGGMYTLIGPYAEIVDLEGPFYGLFPQASDAFLYNRFDNAFEAANTYYHIDSSMRYINETLGITLMPYQYPGGVKFDPHGLSGADNSHYSSSTGHVAFGEGGVDDAEDSDVIHHELGHGLHDWVTSGSLSQVNGLSEGVGDFWAQSYNRSIDSWTPGDPEYNWVFRWDGHNPFWPGRVTDYFGHWPEDLTGQIHTDGQIWSTAMMNVWDAIGKTKTDTAHWEGLSFTDSSTDQNVAANAVFQAALDMGYPTADLAAMRNAFLNTGYIIPPIPIADFSLQADPPDQAICVPQDAVYSIQVQSQFGFSDTVTLSLSGAPAGTTTGFNPNAVDAPYTSTLTIGNTGAAAVGQYDMAIVGMSITATHTTTVGLGLFDAAPGTVTLTSPGDGAVDISLKPLFVWTAAAQGYSYLLEVDDDPGFGSIDYTAVVTGATQHKATDALEALTTYYWRVRAVNPCAAGANSAVFSFTTGDTLPILLVDDDDNGPDVQATYTAALDTLVGPGTYDIWDTNNSDNEPDAATLGAYDIVIWFSGDEFGGFAGPGTDGEAALATWLDNGGCFFISGQDYYYDKGLTPFMSGYLGVASATSDVDQTTVTGQGSIFAGLGPYTLNYPFNNWSDVVNPDGTAELAFAGDSGNAAVNKEGASYMTAYLGFPWEAIPTAGERETVLSTFFDWCTGSAAPAIEATPTSIDDTMIVNSVVTHTLTIANSGGGTLAWSIEEAASGDCASTGDMPWLALSSDSGATAGGGSTEVEVMFDSAGMPAGNHGGALCISSNDAVTPLVSIPLSLAVEWHMTFMPQAVKP